MKFNKTILAAALGAALVPAAANAITVDGITFIEGSIFELVDLYEGRRGGGAIDGLGQELVGVGQVLRIKAPGDVTVWENGDNGRELTVYFYGYIAEALDTAVSGGVGFDAVAFSGGFLELYSDDSPDFSAASTDQDDAIASATDGNLWLTMAGSPVGGYGPPPGENPITLTSVGIRLGNSGDPFQRSDNLTGTGLLDVTGGLAAEYFDTNAFGCEPGTGEEPCDDADKAFTSSGVLFGENPAWPFTGTADVQDFAEIPSVPEPTTLALLGAGLVGLGYRARRKGS